MRAGGGGGIKKVCPESPLFGFFLPIVNFYAEKNMSSFIHSFIKAPGKY